MLWYAMMEVVRARVQAGERFALTCVRAWATVKMILRGSGGRVSLFGVRILSEASGLRLQLTSRER